MNSSRQSAGAEAPSTPIEQATYNLQGMTNVLEAKIDVLEKKLDRVTRPRPPIGTSAAGAVRDAPLRSAHATDLQNAADRIEQLHERLQSLIDAIEV